MLGQYIWIYSEERGGIKERDEKEIWEKGVNIICAVKFVIAERRENNECEKSNK